MSHPDEGVLQELLDGELPEADAAAVRAHLAGCVPCAVVLRDLAAVQAESDAIVARLPLDPPLVKPGTRARPRRAMNLRALALAASVVLVAGTSWVLLRSTQQKFAASDDSAAGLALPMPSEERQEVPAITPGTAPLSGAPTAAPSPTKLRADANADQAAKAKQDSREADAPGEQPMKDMAPQAVAPAEKKENETRSAGAPAPMARMAPAPAAPARIALGGAGASATFTSVADAQVRLGTRLRTISGLKPLSVEVLPLQADSAVTIRQQYLVGGVQVVLVQHAPPASPRDEVTLRERDAAPYLDGVATQPTERGNGFVPTDSTGARPASRTWEAWGSLFELRGALPADSIDALMKRVK